ncbi:MAG: GTPase HflX [Candidatus Omnitrophica bacterium]|nr:GTPase HflX [Candidatus Omnitrophota bacterium]
MEKAVLITVDIKGKRGWLAEDRAAELRELVRSSGVSVEHEIICHREKVTPDLFIGKGKFCELVSISTEKKVNAVIFNNDLTPTQLRNLEKALEGIKVLDRTQLILDIFSQHARSSEGKIQVELAQMEYLLPRLTGKGIELSRLGGGIGTRGPGEKILEYDRRKIRHRISRLKVELKDLERRRLALRKRRKDSMLSTVAIVGYTNAGKTTLLNRLTDSKMLAADKLFSTLDPVARSFVLPNGLKILFHDTVGFLYDLPHHLVESFKATLEEISSADILIHVLDASNPRAPELNEAVHTVLKELGAEKKIMINVLNKIDLVDNEVYLNKTKKGFDSAIAASALRGEGIDLIVDKVSEILSGLVMEIKIEIPNSRMDKVNLIYEKGKVKYREDRSDSVYIEAIVPVRLKSLL